MLVGATIVLGIVIFSLFASYGAIITTNALEIQQAQYYSSGLWISSGSPVGNQVPLIINNFNYKGPIYLVAFFIEPKYSSSASVIAPTNFARINSTSPLTMALTVYDLSGKILYDGNTKVYEAYVGNLELVCFKPGYYTVVWIIVKIDSKYFRIGYYVIE